MNNIGERIQELRKSMKLTQSEFGKMFGVTHAHISSIERGKEHPSEMFMLFIVEKLGIDETWLRTGEGMMYSISNFDTRTDLGNMTKFELLNQNLLDFLSNAKGDELKIIVNIISYFQSSLINNNFTDNEKRILYLKDLENIIKTLDITFANANTLSVLKDKVENYKTLLRFSTKANKGITEINSAIKNILNLYVELYIKNEKLGFKMF